MSDFTVIQLKTNTGTDSSPTWTSLSFGGSGGLNELRFANSGASGTTASASWPYIVRPTSGTSTVSQCWAFTSSDNSGGLQTTYTGDNGRSNVFRWDWDNTGTMVAQPQFSLFASSSHTAPTLGDGSIAGGTTTDTGSNQYSYMKGNAYGSYATANLSAASVGTNPTATTGLSSGNSITCTASDWLNTHGAWIDLQGWNHYIVGNGTPTATTAGDWPWTAVLFIGQAMNTGTFTPVYTLQYTYS